MQQRKTLVVAARNAVQGMRVHQWLKNILIFVPAAAAHSIADPNIFARVFLAFFSFSVCASSGYLMNDLLDLKADRGHPTKRLRPFASGALSRGFAIMLAVLLFLTAIGFGLLVSRRYVLFLCGYLILTVAYSLALKTMVVLDIFLLAFFYTFRIVLGGEAAGVPVSFWLAAFSIFFFFSLAIAKRFVEVRRLLVAEAKGRIERRDYRPEDLPMLGMWGAASGCASVVVLALYINSQDVTRLYRQPAFLWPVCLAVLFWLTRVWMLVNRNELPYDPVEFAVRDWRTYVIAAFVMLSVALAA
jgi:4-hydroxybenzoate polyprenyltransferase